MHRPKPDERLERLARETFRKQWDSTFTAVARRRSEEAAAAGMDSPGGVLDGTLATLVHDRLALLERRTIELERVAKASEDLSRRWRMGFLIVSIVALSVALEPWIERGLQLPAVIHELLPMNDPSPTPTAEAPSF